MHPAGFELEIAASDRPQNAWPPGSVRAGFKLRNPTFTLSKMSDGVATETGIRKENGALQEMAARSSA